jgi:hypothetical protein
MEIHYQWGCIFRVVFWFWTSKQHYSYLVYDITHTFTAGVHNSLCAMMGETSWVVLIQSQVDGLLVHRAGDGLLDAPLCTWNSNFFTDVSPISSTHSNNYIYLYQIVHYNLPSTNNEYHGSRTQKINTAATKASHLICSWTSSTHFPSWQPISLTSILILSSHLLLGLPGGHYLNIFPNQNSPCIPPLPHAQPIVAS